MIDHTLLKPDATVSEIEKLCAEAKKYGFASVCINPSYVPLCAKLLKATEVKVCTVIGFPLGATSTASKTFETEQAIRDGAQEVDMVMNVGMLKSGEYDYVESDIFAVVSTARRYRMLTKVILETGFLTDEEKIKACVLAKRAGADFVKTSTGFGKGGATVGDIALMRRVVGSAMGVKASGGVRSREDALAMVAHGADRIGASASVKIVSGEPTEAVKGY
ncbi:MAG: deoxyribose-phosphate aldolase [Bacteroidota bacterium]